MVNSEDAVTSGLDTAASGDGGVSKASGSVSCSICLEVVADDGSRSWAMLQCGHQFHLDCIGSAFNVKGAMQCPNCRKIEKGQWLYANGSRPYPEWSMDDLNHDEDHYDLSYSEVSVGVHWCPFGQLARFPSVFDDREYSLAAYHEIMGQHAALAEHTAVSAASHPCPYVAYFRPVHPLGNFSGSVSDGSSSNSHWNGPRIANEMPTSYAFPNMDINYHGWEHHCPPFSTGSSNVSAADQLALPLFPQRSARANSDITRPGSFLQPPSLGYSSAGRAGSSIASSMVPPYLGSNPRTQDRVQALQAYYHSQATDSPATQNPMISSTQRANSQRGLTQIGPTVSSTDHSGGFFIYPSATGHNFQEPVNPQPSFFHSQEIDPTPPLSSNQTDRAPNWGPLYQSPHLSSPVIRFSSFHQRHGSERTP